MTTMMIYNLIGWAFIATLGYAIAMCIKDTFKKEEEI